MAKIIDFRKAIAKREGQGNAEGEQFYAEISMPIMAEPKTIDADTAAVCKLASLIANTLAERTSAKFMEMSECMEKAGICMILATLEDMPSYEAVRMLCALFVSNGMTREAEELEMLDLCVEYCDDVYDYFIDFFMQADEIEPFLLVNWLSESDNHHMHRGLGGGYDADYCYM